ASPGPPATSASCSTPRCPTRATGASSRRCPSGCWHGDEPGDVTDSAWGARAWYGGPTGAGMGAFVIYGATGYSGRLIAASARSAGLAPVLSGRNAAALDQLATSLDVPSRAAASSDPGALAAAFARARVVLNAAGPFSRTAEAVLAACLRVGAHYLDITGEAGVIERLAPHRSAARDRRLMIMPAVGFSIVATDRLAVPLARPP